MAAPGRFGWSHRWKKRKAMASHARIHHATRRKEACLFIERSPCIHSVDGQRLGRFVMSRTRFTLGGTLLRTRNQHFAFTKGEKNMNTNRPLTATIAIVLLTL